MVHPFIILKATHLGMFLKLVFALPYAPSCSNDLPLSFQYLFAFLSSNQTLEAI